MGATVAITYGNEARLGPYLAALESVSISPVCNPQSLATLDGLLLTGGSDINPKQYGSTNNGSDEVDDERDELEMRLLREALALDLPVFAICRGLQLFNVVCGGTLIQHLPTTPVHRQKHKDAEAGKHPAAHGISVSPGTRLGEIIGPGEHDVNSRHHQAVGRLGECLIVSATAMDDGVVEAIELPNARFAIAVQWHPEDRIFASATDRKLFQAFAEAIANQSEK